MVTKLAETVERDAHGNVQLSGTGALADLLTGEIRAKLGIKRVRGDTFGYLQRSFLGCVSQTDRQEAREVGEKAVQFAHFLNRDGTVTIHRTGSYAVDYRFTDLGEVAGKTRVMDESLLSDSGNDVTDAFLTYARPLAGTLPTAVRLRDNPVSRILGA